jgi:hypothetical protein
MVTTHEESKLLKERQGCQAEYLLKAKKTTPEKFSTKLQVSQHENDPVLPGKKQVFTEICSQDRSSSFS